MRITAPTAAEPVPLEGLDLTDPRLYSAGDPHAVWRTLRAQAPVFRQELPDGRAFWSVTRYDDCCRVLGDSAAFTSSRGAILAMLGTPDPAGGHQMAVSDPPRHTHLRLPQQQLLTHAAVAPRVPAIRAAVSDLLAPLCRGEGVFDLGAAMCLMPMLVSGMLMGLPSEDYGSLTRLGLMTVAPDDPEFQVDGDAHATLRAAHTGLFAYFSDQIAHRRRSAPPDLGDRDLVGRLMTMRVEGSPLRDGEVVSNCYSMLLGANVNTGHVVSAALLHLLDDPEQYDRWSAGPPALLRSGIREALRWSSPVLHFLRYAAADTEIRGVPVAAGDGVVAWIASANRDDDVFADPYAFRVDRRPNNHIAFGYGPHTCIGAPAGLLTLQVAFEEIFRHVERLELAGPVEHLASNFTAGIRHLPVLARRRR